MMDWIGIAKGIQDELVDWRRQLHSIPEIGFDLRKTSRFVQDRLAEMGIAYSIVAETGICALISGAAKGPTIALRADMDALVLREETGLPFAAANGKMHACGHDAHTAILLATAQILQMNRDLWRGNVKLLFQPAEESSGGAKPMIAAGCLDNPGVDAILGLHVGQLFAEIGNGMIAVRSGPTMGSVDHFIVKVTGRGGHGAIPHQCIDPVPVAAEMITSLQRIVSRELNPLHPAVLTVGLIQGGTMFNIIPETVRFEGTVRTLNGADRDFIEKRLREICQAVALANRASVAIEYRDYYPVLCNDEAITGAVAQSAAKIVGAAKIAVLEEPTLVAEDMAYYLEKVPGTFFFLGTQNPAKGITYPNHHPKFDVDEEVLWIGPAVFAQAVSDLSHQMFTSQTGSCP